MNKLLSFVLVGLFSVYLLNACTTRQERNLAVNLVNNQNTIEIANASEKLEEEEISPSQTKILPGDPKQQALVIGNAKYQSKPLINPVNDANDMADVLHKLGFTVFLHTNLDRQQMEEAIREFKNRLFAQPQSVGLFYFSGHGAQVEGKSYLIPVNNDEIEFDDEVPWKAIEVESKVLKQMQGDNPDNRGLNIILLDACRNNPYPSRPPRGDGTDGLAAIMSPAGVIIGYATAPGRTALDFSEGKDNGLYTGHLLEAIQPNKRIDDLLMQVHNAVKKESNNKQIPWYSSQITRPFCFSGCP